ncbi:MAG: hypothetical protein E7163_06095, partial [Firmicutes bacterium]|nr:hypothetical protein [Bacillota bacterium]
NSREKEGETMNRNLFLYLRELNLTDEEIKYIEQNNQFIYQTSKEHTKLVLDKLREKGITEIELKNLLVKNIYLVTETLDRINKLDNIYINYLNFSNEEIKYLLITNANTYSVSPIELKNIIDYLTNTGYSIEIIKKFILSNPQVISFTLEELKRNLI